MSDEVWITTDTTGLVMDCSPAALNLLGYSERGARGRELPYMFVGARPRLAELFAAAEGHALERDAWFRPNDRKPLHVHFRAAAQHQAGAPVTLRWTFTLRWPLAMRIPRGVDRRQAITVWRQATRRCVFLPGGAGKRRLFVCAEHDGVVHEEAVVSVTDAFIRAAELQELLGEMPSSPAAPGGRETRPAR